MATTERETYYITAEQMARVNTYLPLRAKTEWVELVAEKCMTKVQMSASMNEMSIDLPPMYKENADMKSRYLMGVFVKLYLRGSWEVGEDEDEWLMPIDEYDKWAGGHIFAQIEKFKAEKELRDICFNLLNDYKDLELRLKAEIRDMMAIMNDPASRQMASQQMSMTPEAMEMAIEELNKAQEALKVYEENRKDAIEKAEEEVTNG